MEESPKILAPGDNVVKGLYHEALEKSKRACLLAVIVVFDVPGEDYVADERQTEYENDIDPVEDLNKIPKQKKQISAEMLADEQLRPNTGELVAQRRDIDAYG